MSRKPRRSKDLRRSSAKFAPYGRILIVCEGGKSEPNYFNAIIKTFKLNTANVVVDGSSDSSPRSVVAYAKRLYQEDRKRYGVDLAFDKVYCVFDRDEHTTYLEALSSIKTAQPQNTFHAITSNPCFEFWILLHFLFTTQPVVRQGERTPCEVILHLLTQSLPNYRKGDNSIYYQIKDRTETAIGHAKRVLSVVDEMGTDNPHTLVYRLVEELENLQR